MTSRLCTYCNQDPGVKENTIVWKGFFDQDTMQYVGDCCRANHYKDKFSRIAYRGLYSEVPVTITQNVK